MSTKAALKAAKAALDAKKYDDVITQANTVLADDSKNYFATIFLGRAFEKKGNVEESVKAYNAATKINHNLIFILCSTIYFLPACVLTT